MPKLFDQETIAGSAASADGLLAELEAFSFRGRPTVVSEYRCEASGSRVPVFTNEFWTSTQRAAHSLHEISYRACFKPQLPAFFIERLSRPGNTVYDPFAGRGTTLLEAALRGRVPAGCDVNPLSQALVLPRLRPPTAEAVGARLDALDLDGPDEGPEDLLVFYHPRTLRAICAVRAYLLDRQRKGELDDVDAWIRMVTLNRLTGHSPGFLSVYTLPPNQAVSVKAQRKINAARGQTPPERDLRKTVLRKTASLLADVDDATRADLQRVAGAARLHVGSCTETFWTPGSIQLIVTSPPFLDVVDYAADNWLRCWFCGVSPDEVPIASHPTLEDWTAFIGAAFGQFQRLLAPGGFVAFEVGEVRGGRLRLEEAVIPIGAAAGFRPVAVLINDQTFTKTANIWGVRNNAKGTNSNRIVVFEKPGASGA